MCETWERSHGIGITLDPIRAPVNGSAPTSFEIVTRDANTAQAHTQTRRGNECAPVPYLRVDLRVRSCGAT